MKPSNFARAAAMSGMVLGLGMLAVPAASADAIFNPGGDVAVQEDVIAVDSDVNQVANNETKISEEVAQYLHHSAQVAGH